MIKVQSSDEERGWLLKGTYEEGHNA